MIVIVGGQCKNVGKTALACAVISNFRELAWTAVKLSHAGDALQIVEESSRGGESDTSRMLMAGARSACLVRCGDAGDEELREALQAICARGANVLIESDRAVKLVEPDLHLCVVSPQESDAKESFLRNASRVDAWFCQSEEPTQHTLTMKIEDGAAVLSARAMTYLRTQITPNTR